MRPLIAQILTVFLAGTAFAADTSEEITLDQYLWTARPLVIFAPAEDDPRLVQQLKWLEDRKDEIEERDVVVIIDVEGEEKTPLRDEYHPRDFQIILVGKDGEVKLRKPFPWNVRELSRAIDKMPMRRQEIQAGR